MNKPDRKYTNEDLDLLSGQIKGTNYLPEVQRELRKKGRMYSDGYIYRVTGRFSYNNDIWDAVKAVGIARKQMREQSRAELSQLVTPA